MAEFINREAFKKSVEEHYCLPCKGAGKDYNGCKCRACWVDDMLDEVDCFQPADVAPVVHGRWVDGRCSNCGVYIPTDDAHDAIFANECRFCYYCGAKMDEEEACEADIEKTT